MDSRRIYSAGLGVAVPATEERHSVEVEELDAAEARALFDRMTRHHLRMPAEEFLRRLDAGEWDGVDWDDVDGLVPVMLGLSFAGR